MTIDHTLRPAETILTASAQKMPVLFVGHGNPMNALEDNEFSRAWTELGQTLPRPQAMLCISAHWETTGTQVTALETPPTIHDFGGFPRELFEMQYPAPGSPELARLIRETVQKTPVRLDQEWGLDHGVWSVLSRMFPNADIPVVQLSLDRTQAPAFHYALGKELRALRHKGVLIIGSGNIVHNLRLMAFQDQAYDWANEFDATIARLILSGDHDAIIHYQKLGKSALLAVPTNEHYLPLLYILAMQEPQDQVRFLADRVTLGSMAMRIVVLG